MDAIDLLGKPITVGDRVAWGAGGKYMAGIRVGRVTEINYDKLGNPRIVVKCTTEITRGAGGVKSPSDLIVIAEA